MFLHTKTYYRIFRARYMNEILCIPLTIIINCFVNICFIILEKLNKIVQVCIFCFNEKLLVLSLFTNDLLLTL